LTAVADTSPLLALARLDLLHLLPRLFERTLIPPAVFSEAVERRPNAPGAGAVRRAVREGLLSLAEPRGTTSQLSPPAWLGPSVIGTVRVLEVAREAGLLPRVLPLLEQLRANGFRIRDDLIEMIRIAESDLAT
jgi:uncharacterized protein